MEKEEKKKHEKNGISETEEKGKKTELARASRRKKTERQPYLPY